MTAHRIQVLYGVTRQRLNVHDFPELRTTG
jgi:hypothetical protein